jgi:hypothetical protein
LTRPKAPGGGTRNKADIVAVLGASGTGKSSYIKGELLRKFSRLLAWSPLEKTDDYAGFSKGIVVKKITDLVAAVKAGEKAIIYWPQGTDNEIKMQFDRFCRIVWELENATVLVEELSRVTMASWAPPAWKNLSTAGRHQGLTIIGTSQRPANVDKDFFGNCSEIRCYRLNYEEDCAVMANVMRLRSKLNITKIEAIDRLGLLPDFHYFHKNRDLSLREGVNKSL